MGDLPYSWSVNPGREDEIVLREGIIKCDNGYDMTMIRLES